MADRTPLANSLLILVSKCRYKVVILAHRITKVLLWLGMVEPVLVQQVAGLLWLGMVELVLVQQVADLSWLGMVEPALVRQVAGLLWLGMVGLVLVDQVTALVNLLSTRVRPTPHTTLRCSLGRLELRQGN